MAIWQIDLFIIPADSVLILERIKKQQKAGFEDHIFWRNKLKKIDIFQEIQAYLPQQPFWDEDIILLGAEKSSCIRIIIENNFVVSAVLRLDIRAWVKEKELLKEIVKHLHKHNLMLLDMSSGTHSSNFLEIEEIVAKSSAFLRFHNPQKLVSSHINTNVKTQIAALHELSSRRPLLAREQIELDFLQKMLKADSLADLQSIENEINNTPTDPELIARLLKYVGEIKAFY